MIKSILISGIILNPIAWIGIALGCYLMMNMDLSQIRALALNWQSYAAIAGVSAIYTFIFKRVKQDADKTNWKATFKAFIYRIFAILFMTVLTCFCYDMIQNSGLGSDSWSKIKNNKNVRIMVNEANRKY